MDRKHYFSRGSALIYTMVFMTIMIIIGLGSVNFSSLEQRTAGSFRVQQQAFVAAESILLEAELCVKDETRCSDLPLFDGNCTNGLCFSGTERNSTVLCESGVTSPWEQGDVWRDSSRYINATSVGSTVTGRYIVEFMCYVPKNPFGVTPDPTKAAEWSRLYRITALSVMDSDGARVMLQSTYKL
ncbi:pilus assembly PilX family protein [Endozoicomonas ascidiicola]|uniref:pilus assembly PilX family protein n=1 Tax=Endozoicomonas ascidiicola TaxID=1698521 RepID=UPI000A6F16AB|nr:PilX N-terminal domain-containing pilus assembly protein [Endozoicomonas ascidiicola]